VARRHGAGSRRREHADETQKDTFGKGAPSKPNQNPPQARTNRRSLDAIANDIHALDRTNVFAKGELLLEANEACDYGDWGQWLEDNFGWSQRSAENYMAVARLGRRFETVANLKLPRTALYALTGQAEDLLPAMIDALVKRGAGTTQLKPYEAGYVIRLVRLRHEHGDYTDACLLAIDEWCAPESESDEIIAALKKKNPATKEVAEKIVAAINAKVLARFVSAAPQPPQRPALPQPPQPKPEPEPEPTSERDAVVAACVGEVETVVHAAVSKLAPHERLGLFEELERALQALFAEPIQNRWRES